LNVSTDGGNLATLFVLCGTQQGEWTRRRNVRKAVGNTINGAHSPDAAEGKKVNACTADRNRKRLKLYVITRKLTQQDDTSSKA